MRCLSEFLSHLAQNASTANYATLSARLKLTSPSSVPPLLSRSARIKHLSNPSHKFKVRRNAEQNGLTGMTIFNPSFALVLVEGPQKSIKAYKRLMLVRVDWTDEGRARDPDEGDQLDGAGGGAGTPGPTSSTSATGASAMAQPETDESGAPISLIDNTCELIWEGPLRERLYPRGFRARNAPTDALAREALGPKMAGYWDVAKRWTGVEEV